MASLLEDRDAVSSGHPGDVGRVCRWCGRELPAAWPGFYCAKRCRQSAFRLRRRRERVTTGPGSLEPGRFAYADPPYVGLAKRFYGDQESYAGEVDHVALISGLEARRVAGELRGWALSCSTASLGFLLPLCPGYRLGTWVKPGGVPLATFGIHSRQEHVIVVGGRKVAPGIRDWLMAHPARGGGDLPGRKPIAFCAWLFDLLGMVQGDKLDDLFPGTGVVGRSWGMLCSVTPAGLGGVRPVFQASLVDAEGGASLVHEERGASLLQREDAASLLEERRGVAPTPDACDRCGDVLEAGRYSGGCEVCDFLLCVSCAGAHPVGLCDGEGVKAA